MNPTGADQTHLRRINFRIVGHSEVILGRFLTKSRISVAKFSYTTYPY
jgi:hypothetical protein